MSSKGDWSWIDDELRRLGISRNKLANLLGISPPAVSKWIQLKQDPGYEHLAQLAAIFTHGDLNRLYLKARFNWAISLQHLDTQAKGIGVDPSFANPDTAIELIPLHIPATSVRSNDPVTDMLVAESILASSALLRQANQFAAMRDQAMRLIKRLNGSRSHLTGQMWYALADAELMLGNYPESLEAADAARRIGRQNKSGSAFIADVYAVSGESWRIMGQPSVAREHFAEANRLYDQAGVVPFAEGRMWVAWHLGRVATSEARYDEATEHFDRARTIAQQLRHGSGMLSVRYGEVMIDDLQGNLDDALSQYGPMQRDARKDGNTYWDAMIAWKTADVLRRQGHVAQAMSMAHNAIHTYEALDNPDMVASVTFTFAYCHIHLGRIEQARAMLASVAARFTNNIDQTTVRMARIGESFALLAHVARSDTPHFDALLPLLRTEMTAPRLSLRFELLQALFAAEALRLTGHESAAHERYRAIVKQAMGHDHQLEHAHALLGLAECSRLLGRPDREMLKQAVAIYDRIGSAWGRAHARIAQWLIDPNAAAQQLHQAKQIAHAASFADDLALIERLQNDPRPNLLHPLVFV